jgi:carbohydrate binding protein with CBM4/9 domain/PEP-CTERM motif-containing protein
MRTCFITAVGSLVLACGVATTASAQLVTNGGFETGDFSGWTTFGNFEFSGVSSLPHSGNFGAFFGPVGAVGGISQNIATNPGQSYTFSFWLAGGGDPVNSVEADWDGSTVFGVSDAFFPGFTQETFTKLASSSLTNISFSFQNDPQFWILDDVSVTSASVTPEPGTMGLMATGLVGMIGAGYRRKRRA